jgi:hypothetical protein
VEPPATRSRDRPCSPGTTPGGVRALYPGRPHDQVSEPTRSAGGPIVPGRFALRQIVVPTVFEEVRSDFFGRFRPVGGKQRGTCLRATRDWLSRRPGPGVSHGLTELADVRPPCWRIYPIGRRRQSGKSMTVRNRHLQWACRCWLLAGRSSVSSMCPERVGAVLACCAASG